MVVLQNLGKELLLSMGLQSQRSVVHDVPRAEMTAFGLLQGLNDTGSWVAGEPACHAARTGILML